MSDPTFDWSVAKLNQLNFDGDSSTLAAYVNALIENNRDAEGSDPKLLESRALQELEDFVGAGDAKVFVSGLMRHLAAISAKNSAPPMDAPPAQPTEPPASHDAKAPPTSHSGSSGAPPAPTPPVSTAPSAAPVTSSPAKARHSSRESGVVQAHANANPTVNSNANLPGGRATGNAAPYGRGVSLNSDGRRNVASRMNGGDPGTTQKNHSRSRADVVVRHPHEAGAMGREAGLPRDGAWRASTGRDVAKAPQFSSGGANTSAHMDLRAQLSRPSFPKRVRERDGRDYDIRTRLSDDRVRGHPVDQTDPSKHAVRRAPGSKRNEMDPSRIGSTRGPAGTPGIALPGMGFVPGPPPAFLHHMQSMMPKGAPPPGFPGVPGMMPPHPGAPAPGGFPPYKQNVGNMHRDRGRDRTAQQTGHGRVGQAVPGNQRGRMLSNVLVLRNVPTEKLTLGAINEYFQKFGTVSNIQLRPAQNPDHAFVEFSHRSEAQEAHNSVEAVMGNRHVRLFWAREGDFEQSGIPLDGVPRAPVGQDKKRNFQQVSTTEPPKEDAESALKRKRKEIAMAREEQVRVKAERKAAYDKCIAEQKSLFAKLEAGDSSAGDKKGLLKNIKALGKEAERLLGLMKAKDPTNSEDVGASTPNSMADKPAAFARRGPMSADFRPKIVHVRDASAGLKEEAALNIFHETVSAKLVDGVWILDFSSRRAAESATKALGPLKRWFGPNAKIMIVDSRTDTRPSAPIVPSTEELVGEKEGPVGEDDGSGGGVDGAKESSEHIMPTSVVASSGQAEAV